MHIGTVKFACKLKESPCSAVATFPSFGSERHGSDPIGGTPKFFSSFVWHLISLSSYNLFFFGPTKLGVKRPVRKRSSNVADRRISTSSHVIFALSCALLACIQYKKTCQSTDLDSGKVVLFWKTFNNGLRKNYIT